MLEAETTTDRAVTVQPVTVFLDTSIKRGSQTVTQVVVRKPCAGELRGVSLVSLLQMDVAALQAVLPRVTTPVLARSDIDQLDPCDLVQLGTEASNFLLSKADRALVFHWPPVAMRDFTLTELMEWREQRIRQLALICTKTSYPSASTEFVVLVSECILLFVVAPIVGILLYWLWLDEEALLRDIKVRADYEA